jgi:hypothetical protein
MKSTRQWYGLLLLFASTSVLGACAKKPPPPAELPSADRIDEPEVRVTTESPTPGATIVIEGSFTPVKAIRGLPVLIQFWGYEDSGIYSAHGGGIAQSVKEKAGRFTYRAEVEAPPQPGEYDIKVFAGELEAGNTKVRVESSTASIP